MKKFVIGLSLLIGGFALAKSMSVPTSVTTEVLSTSQPMQTIRLKIKQAQCGKVETNLEMTYGACRVRAGSVTTIVWGDDRDPIAMDVVSTSFSIRGQFTPSIQ